MLPVVTRCAHLGNILSFDEIIAEADIENQAFSELEHNNKHKKTTIYKVGPGSSYKWGKKTPINGPQWPALNG